jgi:hypothetical protein
MKQKTPQQRYIRRVPKRIPKGVALVHNFMPTPFQAMNPAFDGYRIFYVPYPFRGNWKRLRPCECGAYHHLPEHFNSRTDLRLSRWMQVRSDPQPLDTLACLKTRLPKLSRHEISSRMMSIHGIRTASKRLVQSWERRGKPLQATRFG